MTVRVRGIYATALSHLLDEVVQASPPIQARFDADLPHDPAAAVVATSEDRQGVRVTGDPERVEAVVERLAALGLDALAWSARLPEGAVYAGEVTETLGGGAVVDLGDGEGYLPYGTTSRRIESGDRLRVQVRESAPPWARRRPALDTTVRVGGPLATLVRGRSREAGRDVPDLADLIEAAPPEGWGIDWGRIAEEASLDALDAAVAGASERATSLDEALAEATAPTEIAPATYWEGPATSWVWFGRETRFALDEARRAVAPTMAGHHRIKAGAETASAAVDLVEAVCADAAGEGNPGFPFDAVTRQFGPTEGDTVAIGHGKPDGSYISLGEGEVTGRDAGGSLTVEREMSAGGTYDALDVERQAGDVATTSFKEGRWWYPTVYEGRDGERRGTYVNVCTPVEAFPETVRYVDLYVDVVKHADGIVERVDDDELDAAVEAGHVPEDLATKARSVATAVEGALS
jgi:hypothetical protein